MSLSGNKLATKLYMESDYNCVKKRPNAVIEEHRLEMCRFSSLGGRTMGGSLHLIY